jgi:hypothetical protein
VRERKQEKRIKKISRGEERRGEERRGEENRLSACQMAGQDPMT